ncbi:hypothetical protein LJC23_00425 [Desulfovibrio sp. OttesenSCG-928-I05]|nr:hypothetical protein [Desulfovibrio sp. OttesenSCG-928-I05]
MSLQAGVAAGAIKDATAGQVITKTLDKLNTSATLSGPAVNADYQFQKDVLGAAGIGQSLDMKV